MKIPEWLPHTHHPVGLELNPREPLIGSLLRPVVQFLHIEAAGGLRAVGLHRCCPRHRELTMGRSVRGNLAGKRTRGRSSLISLLCFLCPLFFLCLFVAFFARTCRFLSAATVVIRDSAECRNAGGG